jgi:UDP-glucose 4-epimerase
VDSSGGPIGGTGRDAGKSGSDTLHYPKVVLVTGACRFLGGYLTARLAQNPLINRVIAVDAIAPSKDMLRRMGRAEFVRADIRNPFIGKVIRNGQVDTVVHAAAASYAPRSGGGAALKELNVMGAMQLFAACQKAPSVRRVVLKSTSEVYGSSAHDPVMFTEDSSSRRLFRQGFPKDSLDIEGYARGLGRRRTDVAVTILRLANMIGPAMDTTLSRYLAGPLVPTVIGQDAPGVTLWALDSLRRANRYSEINREQLDYLSYGRVMDTTRMREDLGYQPRWTTAEAFDDYVRGRALTPIIDPQWVRSLEDSAVLIAQRLGSRTPSLRVGGR